MQFEDGFHRGLPLLPPDLSEDPDSEPAAGAAGKGAKRPARPLRAGTAAGRSHLLIFLAPFSSEAFSPLGPRIEPRKRGPKSSSSGAGDDADGEALSAVEHQDEIVGIGGVDRLDRGVGDGIEGSAIVVLVVN